jgi:aminoglycoside phosphotransferase (APT) family kinase protein
MSLEAAKISGPTGHFQQDQEALLGLVIRDLEAVVLPNLTDDSARFTGAILVKLLRMLKLRTNAAPLAADVTSLTAQVAQHVGTPDLWRHLQALAVARARLDLGGAVTSLTDSFAESGAGTVALAAPKSAAINKLTPAALADCLATRFPEWQPVAVTEFREVGTGSQKTIFFVAVQTQLQKFEWALRQDKPFSSFSVTAKDEFPLLIKLHQAGLPVAKPVWYMDPSAATGGALYATERLSGSANYAAWAADRARAEPIVAQVAALMARLHALDPARIAPVAQPLPGTVGGTPARCVDHLAAFWNAMHFDEPVVDACLSWLRHNAPENFTRRAVVHGDFAFHNLLVDDGRLTGLLDWEFAHIGDPVEDIVYIQPFIAAMGCWEFFLSTYQAAGGDLPTPEIAKFWRAFGMLRLAIGSFNSVKAVRDGFPDIDIRVANSGYLYAGQILVETVKIITGESL